MMNPAFDTLAALRNLEASGLDSTHAEAIVQVVSQVHEQVATKGDIAGLQTDTSAIQEEIRVFQEEFRAFQIEFRAFQDTANANFASSRNEMKEGLVAVRQEWKKDLAAFRTEVESKFIIQDGKFQAALSSAVNKMLIAQVAVAALVVAVLRLLMVGDI